MELDVPYSNQFRIAYNLHSFGKKFSSDSATNLFARNRR
jgi:hypothetical protein